jgi:SAM-dependent methyltransferase
MRRCVACATGLHGGDWRCPSCGFEPDDRGAFLSFCETEGIDGFDPDAFDRLASLEQASFWFRSRNRLIAWAVREYFPDAASLLEIGCGTGFVLAGLERDRPELRLAGAELYAGGLRHAAERTPSADFFQFDARDIPFEAEFDVVGAFDVLEHIDRDEDVLAGMHTAVAPGGGIVVTVPQHGWLWSASDDYAEHKRRYSRAELTSKVTRAGFSVRRATSFVSLLLPLMAASRLAERLSSRPYEPSREHQSAQRADAPLERIADAELWALQRGVNFPAGGSLLLIATRR